jgi:serine phosphatase RsbU (regulator of sigma subunit)
MSSKHQRPPEPGTGPVPRAHLEIRLDDGPPTHKVLSESHAVIGRVPGVQVLLDHHTVSRRHAEMFCDPFGRWWIRDLGSTNGTTVRGEPVEERVLSPGDRITVGDFSIVFSLGGQGASRPSSYDLAALDDDKPTAIRRLADLEAPRIAASHLSTLLAFSRRLLSIDEQDQRMDALCELVIREDFHATLAVVIRMKGARTTMVTRAHRPGPPSLAEGRPHISRRVLDILRSTREPVLATNMSQSFAGAAVELSMARDVMELWVIACPFRVADDEIDVLYATIPRDCASAEWLSLFALAAEVHQQGEAAWTARRHAQEHAAIERELQTARQIQRGLLPKELGYPGLDVSVGFEPCKWVGGDYVDVVPMPDGRVVLAVADVCGKGLQAALVSSSLNTMVRASADANPSVPALMERVNRHLCEWLPSHSFVTMVCASIVPSTGEIECVNAGHPPVLLVDARGNLRTLQAAENPALGIAPSGMEGQRTRLEPGEVLAMYTDGLTELRDPSKEMLGEERLGVEFARLCARARTGGTAAIASGLLAMLEQFRAGELPEDDQTFLLARRS